MSAVVQKKITSSGGESVGYLLGMFALAVGSIPFCHAIGSHRWIPQRFAAWGAYGYAALAIGVVLELVTGRSLAVIFAVPGGLFELALGMYLVRYGFRRATTP